MAATLGLSIKDSSLCLALRCDCGYSGHHHGYFTYHVMCGQCGKVYRVDFKIKAVKVEPRPDDLIMLDDKNKIVGSSDIAQRWEDIMEARSRNV